MFDMYNVDSLFRDFKINCITNNDLSIKENRFRIFKTTKIYQILESNLKSEIITSVLVLFTIKNTI